MRRGVGLASRHDIPPGTTGSGGRIRLEVKAAHADLSVAETSIRTAEKALEQARENLRIIKLEYRQQIVTSTEVPDAAAFLTGARNNYHGALYGYYTALAELQGAVGGR